MTGKKALRILVDIHFPAETVRLWDGSGGPFVDGDGNIYRAAQFTEEALQSIQAAMNAEASTLTVSLSNIDGATGAAMWEEDEESSVIGSKVVIKIQYLDARSQPVGDPDVKFTGKIDNLSFQDQATDTGITSVITADISNRFTLLARSSGVVLFDVDQKERSKRLNPAASLLGKLDRFCERVPLMRDKTVKWPNW